MNTDNIRGDPVHYRFLLSAALEELEVIHFIKLKDDLAAAEGACQHSTGPQAAVTAQSHRQQRQEHLDVESASFNFLSLHPQTLSGARHRLKRRQ